MKDKDLGVIIGRFQCDNLHKGHISLIRTVRDECKDVLILVGCSIVGQPTRKYPLPYESVKKMLLNTFGRENIDVLPILDIPASDEEWSNQVDYIISLYSPNLRGAYLYGSRDSFIKSYKGKFECIEVPPCEDFNATEIRNNIAKRSPENDAERRGTIWAVYNKFPVAYQCVDIAIISMDKTKIVLGRKKGEKLWRFPGGFVDPSETLEEAAMREVKEETNLDIYPCALRYIGSFSINDGRYKYEVDKITSALFVGISNEFEFIEAGENIEAGDDLEEARIFDFNYSLKQIINDSHKPLFEKLIENC